MLPIRFVWPLIVDKFELCPTSAKSEGPALLLMMLLLSVAVALPPLLQIKMPPPFEPAEFWEKVLLVAVTVPLRLNSAPPSPSPPPPLPPAPVPPAPPMAELLAKVLLVMTTVPP